MSVAIALSRSVTDLLSEVLQPDYRIPLTSVSFFTKLLIEMKDNVERDGAERASEAIAKVENRGRLVTVILCLLSFIAGGLVFGHENSGAYLFAFLGILVFSGLCVGSVYVMAKIVTDFRNRNRHFHFNPGSRSLK